MLNRLRTSEKLCDLFTFYRKSGGYVHLKKKSYNIRPVKRDSKTVKPAVPDEAKHWKIKKRF